MKQLPLIYTIAREPDCHELVYDAKVEDFVDKAKKAGGRVTATFDIETQGFSLIVDFPRHKWKFGKTLLDSLLNPPEAMAA